MHNPPTESASRQAEAVAWSGRAEALRLLAEVTKPSVRLQAERLAVDWERRAVQLRQEADTQAASSKK